MLWETGGACWKGNHLHVEDEQSMQMLQPEMENDLQTGGYEANQ